tara:strand:- start:13 stop:300 length:288 start_codon:yes stop_codon:yes gene_type:complete
MVGIMERAKDIKNIELRDASALMTLDLTGLKCPLPVLKARRQIGQMAAGAVLEIKADDPAAPLDFQHFCHTGGYQLLKSKENNGVFTMLIAKSAV